MKLIFLHETLKQIVIKFGWDNLLLFLQDMCLTFDLCNVSTA
jgi:hypothetical protein